MARLYLFGEGKTEATFADLLLRPRLANHNVFLRGVAWLRGRSPGRWQLRAMENDIRNRLTQDKAPDVFFTTMIDLYGHSRVISSA